MLEGLFFKNITQRNTEDKQLLSLFSWREKQHYAGPSLSAQPPAFTAVDKTSGRQDLFGQSSPGTYADTETVIRQALGRSRGIRRRGGEAVEKERRGDDVRRGEGCETGEHGVQCATHTQKSKRIKI